MNDKSQIKVLHENACIRMNTTFAKMAENPMSDEYKLLQELRRDYPEYSVSRRQIKKNSSQEHYKGLTYEYMEWYIIKYGSNEEEERKSLLAEFEHQKDIASCHSKCKRYPVVKNWFLSKFPEIAKFGLPEKEKESSSDASSEVAVTPTPAGLGTAA